MIDVRHHKPRQSVSSYLACKFLLGHCYIGAIPFIIWCLDGFVVTVLMIIFTHWGFFFCYWRLSFGDGRIVDKRVTICCLSKGLYWSYDGIEGDGLPFWLWDNDWLVAIEWPGRGMTLAGVFGASWRRGTATNPSLLDISPCVEVRKWGLKMNKSMNAPCWLATAERSGHGLTCRARFLGGSWRRGTDTKPSSSDDSHCAEEWTSVEEGGKTAWKRTSLNVCLFN